MSKDIQLKRLDEIICNWSMKFGIAMSEQALEYLEDKLLEEIYWSPPPEVFPS